MTQDLNIHFISSSSRSNSVKISFHHHKNSRPNTIRAKLSIGVDIAKKLKWRDGDHLIIEGNRDELFVLKYRPDDDNEYMTFMGHKFKKVNGSYSYSVSFTSPFIPHDRKIRSVPFEIKDDINNNKCLKIFLEMIE